MNQRKLQVVSPIIAYGALAVMLLGTIGYWQYGTPFGQILNTPPFSMITKSVPKTTSVSGSLYVSRVDGTSNVFRIAADGTKEKIFSFPSQTGQSDIVSSTADAKKIAYVDQKYDLYIYDVDAKKSTLVKASVPTKEDISNISEAYAYQSAVISPDGKFILAGVGQYENGYSALISSDGKTSTQLPCTIGDYAWSPDSSHFAVASTISQFSGANSCLYIGTPTSPDTGKNVLPIGTNGFSKNAFTPSWSPDSSKVAFAYEYLDGQGSDERENAKHRGVYVVNADGSSLAEVTGNQSYSTNPVWKDTETILYGLSNRYGGTAKGIYAIGVDGSNNTLVYSNEQNSFAPINLFSDKNTLLFTSDDDMADPFVMSAKYTVKTFILDLSSKKATALASTIITNP